MRRRCIVPVLLAALLLAAFSGATTAAAQDDELEVTTTTGQVEGFGDIIPQPDSGTAPQSATDRGGWGQYAVLGGIVVALGIMAGLVVLESRRKRVKQS